MSRALLLDYGGVLSGTHGAAEGAEIAAILGVEAGPLESAYWEHRRGYDLGALSGRDYWRRVADTLGVPAPDAALPRLLEVDAAGWGHLVPAAVEWAADAARRVPTGLLSNMPHEVRDPLVPLIAGAVPFRELLFSCDLRVAKPDLEAYRLAVARMGTEPGATVMVDDRPANVHGALRAGLRAVLFTTAAESIPEIERALAA